MNISSNGTMDGVRTNSNLLLLLTEKLLSVNIVIEVVAVGFISTCAIDARYSEI